MKAHRISVEHLAMEQILAEVQKMESALKMISNHSRTQAEKSSFRGTGAGVPAKEKSSPENSSNGHKYFHRGNITASISQCFMTKHYKNIEERDTLLFTILFNKKHKYHTASFCHFLCQNII